MYNRRYHIKITRPDRTETVIQKRYSDFDALKAKLAVSEVRPISLPFPFLFPFLFPFPLPFSFVSFDAIPVCLYVLMYIPCTYVYIYMYMHHHRLIRR